MKTLLLPFAFAFLLVATSAFVRAQDKPATPPVAAPAAGTAPPAASTGAPTAAPSGAQAATPQTAPAPGQKETAPTAFSAEKLEQMAAPIALYPDPLVSQIMMASTYPLEIVQASRWQQKNPSLKDSALDEALKAQDWDPSVKSLIGFPTVLKEMSDNLDWTQDLGDAFLGQKTELMETIQKMRRKALDAGNLKSTDQQKVTQEDKIIIIQPADPKVIYVPTYSPTVVYGPSWYYPYYYYPPMYAPPAPGYGFVAFGAGIVVGAAIWGNCNWHSNNVNINVNNYNNFNKVTNTNINAQKYNRQNNSGGQGDWNHNPEHRKGVNYKDGKTAKQYGANSGTNRVSSDQARGFENSASRGGASPSTRPSNAGAGSAAGTRDVGAKPSTGAQRPTGGANTNRAGAATSNVGSTTNRASAGGSSALSGSRSPSMDRSASTRGAASRPSGGGSRGGGGRGGGGGRR